MNFTKKSVLCLGLMAGMLQSCTLDEPSNGGNPGNGEGVLLESITSGYNTLLKVEYDNSKRPTAILFVDGEETWKIEYNPLRFVCTEYEDGDINYPDCVSVYDDIQFYGSYISSMRVTETDYTYNYSYDYETDRDIIELVDKIEYAPVYSYMTYDNGGHLVKIDSSEETVTYTWNGNGNLVEVTERDKDLFSGVQPYDANASEVYKIEYGTTLNTYGVWLPIWPGTSLLHMLGYLGVAPNSLPTHISDYYDDTYFAYKVNANNLIEAIKVTGNDSEGTLTLYYL